MESCFAGAEPLIAGYSLLGTSADYYRETVLGGAGLAHSNSIFTRSGPNCLGAILSRAQKLSPGAYKDVIRMVVTCVATMAWLTIHNRWLQRTENKNENTEDASTPEFLAVIFRVDYPKPSEMPPQEFLIEFIEVCFDCLGAEFHSLFHSAIPSLTSVPLLRSTALASL